MERFGTYGGRPVELIRLRGGGLACEILTCGATLRSLTVPGRDGRLRDVVLGFDTTEAYARHDCCFGATVGPVANRIAGASCPLGAQTLRLTDNDGGNCLHSGAAGLDRQLWEPAAVSADAVTLRCVHPDGRGGIPGDLRAEVTYRLGGGALHVEYRAESERDTLCNFTNHSYFNLDGHDSGSIEDHRIQILAGRFTPTDAHAIPTGALQTVDGTPMDLREPVRIGARIGADCRQLRQAGGFDHNWVLDAPVGADAPDAALRLAARVWAADAGIVLRAYTDRPGVQFYTGNYIPAGLRGKGGAVYGPRQGLCLETQAFPDAPHHPDFPSIVLRAGEIWHSRTVFRFDVQ